MDSTEATKPAPWSWSQQKQRLITLVDNGWASVGLCSMCAVAAYGLLLACQSFLPFIQAQEERFHATVPALAYHLSAAAFFTNLILSLVSLIFEDSPAKQQHAWLSCLVQCLVMRTDVALASGSALVLAERSGGAMWLPWQYAQRAVALPVLLFSVSRTSDATPLQVGKCIGGYVAMEAAGFAANLWPLPQALACFAVSLGLMYMVLKGLHRMVVATLGDDPVSLPIKQSWKAIFACCVCTWSLVPLAWLLNRLVPQHGALPSQAMVLVANFLAMASLTSSVVFGNYRTASQRRIQAAQALENEERVALVTQLTQVISQKDEFMSLMSHELRTPLNGIIQLSDFLVGGSCGPLGDKAKRFSGTIKNSGLQLLNIINDILDAAALKEGRLAIKHERVNMGQVVEQVVDLVASLARNGVVIEHKVHPRTPAIVGDAGRITQILFNLMGNALKFTHAGKVSLTVRPGSEPHYITLTVADTGIGIPQDKIQSIFEAFEQVDMSVSRKYGGTGLGLKIVQSLVEAHRGTIQVTSELGHGTQFTVRLPVLQRGIRESLEGSIRSTLHTQGYDFDGVASALQLNSSADTAHAIPRKSSSFYVSRTSSNATSSSSGSRPASFDRGPIERPSAEAFGRSDSFKRGAAARAAPARRSSLSIVSGGARNSMQGERPNGVVPAGEASDGGSAPALLTHRGGMRRLTPVSSNDDVFSSSGDASSGGATPPAVPGGSKPPTRPSSMESRRSVEFARHKTLVPTKSL